MVLSSFSCRRRNIATNLFTEEKRVQDRPIVRVQRRTGFFRRIINIDGTGSKISARSPDPMPPGTKDEAQELNSRRNDEWKKKEDLR
jgi:hypothetical protein